MMRLWFVLGNLLLSGTHALNIAFTEGSICTGQPLYGSTDVGNTPCYNISGYSKSQSVLIRNLDVGQVVRFYSDDECNVQVHSALHDECYMQDENVLAFNIITEISTGSLMARGSASNSTDLVKYGVKLSDYTGLATVPESSDIAFSNFFLGTTALASSGTLSFAAGVLGCYSTDIAPGKLGRNIQVLASGRYLNEPVGFINIFRWHGAENRGHDQSEEP